MGNENKVSIFNEEMSKYIIPQHIKERKQNLLIAKCLRGKFVDLELLWYDYLDTYIIWLNKQIDTKKNLQPKSKFTDILYTRSQVDRNREDKENDATSDSTIQKCLPVIGVPVSDFEEGNIISKIQDYL